MANDEAKIKEYMANKRIFNLLEIENTRKIREIENLEKDIKTLNRAEHYFEYEIDDVYSKTKKELCSVGDDMVFVADYMNSLNELLRGSNALQAEHALNMGKRAAYKEIMRLEEEVDNNSRRLDIMAEDLRKNRP